MSEFSSFAEKAVTKEAGRMAPLTKIVSSLVSVMLLVGAIGMAGSSLYFAFVFGVVFLLFTLLVTRRVFTVVEYEYTTAEGELSFAEIRNHRRRKERGSVVIAELEMIAPYREPYLTELERRSFEKVHHFESSSESPDLYVAVAPRPNDPSSYELYFFEPSAKMLRVLSFYNRRTVVDRADRDPV